MAASSNCCLIFVVGFEFTLGSGDFAIRFGQTRIEVIARSFQIVCRCTIFFDLENLIENFFARRGSQ